jgi:uncharacterized protein YcfJ
MNTSLVVKKTKRFLALVLMLFTFAFVVTPIISPTGSEVSAHVTGRRHRHRSFWRKHRDKLTVAGTALGGAAIGGIAGGKKGALIGTGVGAGSGALYTYKIRKRRHRRY